MSETIVDQDYVSDARLQLIVRGSTIRCQLILASLFPLAFFSFLSILVTSVTINQIASRLALQGNLAEIRAAADDLSKPVYAQQSPVRDDMLEILRSLGIENGGRLYLVNESGNLLVGSNPDLTRPPISSTELHTFFLDGKPESKLMISSDSGDQAIISFSPVEALSAGVILEVPWTTIITPAFYYQLLLAGLLALGTLFSLYMLSLSIGRVIRPIAELANRAIQAIPGSIFRPMPEQGPEEISNLIKAFNQMVIRLAEQQGTMRQYAHKALLSQEEERQRLSHELHDGTVQDLVGLSQRVELCRNELERDPDQARYRLDELQALVEQTLSNVRRISNALRPSILEDLGLSVSLQALCSDLEKQMPSVRCDCVISDEQRRLPPDIELAIFRVVQEALVNVRKHSANATNVEVELNFGENDVQAIVRNDGSIFPALDLRSQVRTGHLGLAGMYERARLFHGELEIVSDPENVTTVRLRLPIYVIE
ncbi:MAG: histidine kinase [Anaerolineales bacterium]